MSAALHLACGVMLLAVAGAGQATESPTQPAPEDACRGWRFADHRSPAATQWMCLQRMPATRLTRIPYPALDAEIQYQYAQSALLGERATAEILRRLVAERERRRPPKEGAASRTVYAALVAAGALDDEEQERQQKRLADVADLRAGHLRPLASLRAQDASYWSFSAGGDVLVESSIDLQTGPRVVVYAAPGCSFCARLSKDLAADPALLALFKAHAIWVDVPDINFSAGYYDEWNRAHPELKIHVILNRRHWPQRRIAATPDLFFLKDGQQVGELLGWTPERMRQLRDRLAAIGLLK
ncbi:hypothetical protein [Aquabacterium sp.]|uniref:hypothetical protein n=1 Tax=Aquabacterium sp. TaxID=1872578 RepID=UPI0037848FB5